MKLKRHGFRRYSGHKCAFSDRSITSSMSKSNNSIRVTITKANGMGSTGLYTYILEFSEQDLLDLLAFVITETLRR
jgi:hypothetical protein